MQQDFVSYRDKILSYFDKNEKQQEFVEDALLFGYNCHKNQKRDSGKPYFFHPLEVAQSLAEKDFNYKIVSAALLHDTIEDSDVPLQTIMDRYGNTVGDIVSLVTKPKLSPYYEWVFADHPNFTYITNEHYKTERDKYYTERISIYYNRLFKSGNVNALYVKLYDNLNNVTDFVGVSKEKRTKNMENIMKHTVWLAKRLLNNEDFEKIKQSFSKYGYELTDDDYRAEQLTNPIVVMPPRERIGFELYKKMPLAGTKYISVYSTTQSLLFKDYLEIGLPGNGKKDYLKSLQNEFPEHKISRAKSLVPKSVGAHERIYKVSNFRKPSNMIKVNGESLFLNTDLGKVEIKNYPLTKVHFKGKLKKIYIETRDNYYKFREKLEKFFQKHIK